MTTNPERLWVTPFQPNPNKPARFLVHMSDEEAHEMRCEERGACQNGEMGATAEYVLASVAAKLKEERDQAYADRDHERETQVWLAGKNDTLEGKLAAMTMAANPAVYDSLAMQQRRHEEMAMLLNEKDALRRERDALAKAVRRANAALSIIESGVYDQAECMAYAARGKAAIAEETAAANGLAKPAKLYLPWTEAGGPNECAHGYADGIPCPECDKAAAKGVG